jgi:hypothetical protein
MGIEEKNRRITELSEADFLAFLYAERDREESLSKYQGWNIWAVAGALVTVICAAYSVLCRNKGALDSLNVAFYVSGLIALFLCLRPLLLIKSRPRGVDYSKVKLLKDIVPRHYLYLALFASISFSVSLPFMNKDHPWGVVTILWMILAILFIFTTVFVFKNKNSVVRADLDGRLFIKLKCEALFGGILGGVLSLLVVNSFTIAKGPFIGSPDFEISVCIVAIVVLLYIIAKIRKEVKAAERLDVVIDDYLYKGRPKNFVYNEILLHRMGYSVLEACQQELSILLDSLRTFETRKGIVERVIVSFAEGSLDINRMSEYIEVFQNSSKYVKKLNNQIKALGDRLTQIAEENPDIEINADFIKMQKMQISLLKQANEMMRIIINGDEKMKAWIQVYHCRKYGGWCLEECEERLKNPSLRYRFEMFLLKIKRLSSFFKMRKPCKTSNHMTRKSL